MANTRPIRTKRWGNSFQRKRKIPQSRIAHATDWFPSFVTVFGSDVADSRLACPTHVTVSPGAGASCRATAQLDILPQRQVQRFQDHVGVVEVRGDFWWRVNTDRMSTCADTDIVLWNKNTMLRVDPRSAQHTYNPWDISSGGTALETLFEEGDFTAPAERIIWQTEYAAEAHASCSDSDSGTNNVVLTATGILPVGDVSGTLVTGSGVISTSCMPCANLLDVDIRGTVTDSGTIGNVIEEMKLQHIRVRWRGYLPCKGDDEVRLQFDWANPYEAQGTNRLWDIDLFGSVKAKLRLALRPLASVSRETSSGARSGPRARVFST